MIIYNTYDNNVLSIYSIWMHADYVEVSVILYYLMAHKYCLFPRLAPCMLLIKWTLDSLAKIKIGGSLGSINYYKNVSHAVLIFVPAVSKFNRFLSAF